MKHKKNIAVISISILASIIIYYSIKNYHEDHNPRRLDVVTEMTARHNADGIIDGSSHLNAGLPSNSIGQEAGASILLSPDGGKRYDYVASIANANAATPKFISVEIREKMAEFFVYPAGPKNANEIIKSELADAINRAPQRSSLHRIDANNITIGNPMFMWGIDIISDNIDFNFDNNVLLYPIEADGRVVANVQLNLNGEVGMIDANWRPQSIANSLLELMEVDQMKGNAFTPIVLQIIGAGDVIWLKAVSGSSDWFYPVVENNKLKKKLYTLDDLKVILGPEIKSNRDNSDVKVNISPEKLTRIRSGQ
jgi:hypothetical protein